MTSATLPTGADHDAALPAGTTVLDSGMAHERPDITA
jgi:hypothetical protein